MHQIRTVPETDLLIVSGCIDPVLARDFQDEWIDQLRPEQRRELEFTQKKFFDDDYSVEEVFWRPELPATHRVLELLGFSREDGAAMGLNFQAPYGKQNFHKDNHTLDGVVYVVHGADGGAFDYAPDAQTEREAETSFLSVEVGAGDVLLQHQQPLFHRGRNASPLPRVTAAIARVDTSHFYDQSR